MARIYLQKTLHSLIPADDDAREALKRWKLGDTLACDVVKPREHKSLRRYWAMVNLVLQNTDQFKSKEQLHAYLKIRAGHCTPIASNTTGEVFYVPDSIDYATLDENQFMQVWVKIVNVICEEILPGLDSEAMELEIQRVCGLAA